MEFTLLWMKLQTLKRGQGILENITQHKKTFKIGLFLDDRVCLSTFSESEGSGQGERQGCAGEGKGTKRDKR